MSDRGIRRAVFVAACYVLVVLFFYAGHEVGRAERNLHEAKRIVRSYARR